ncbi:hypothetical protein [Nocardia gipuzkoensis]|uniref:hypothetical protein n=1 Tax=Nocardia gipuzkoensis TaxID=2749991 RepID=UPI00237DDA40|nr:hypothetical protein [Nocardia gipuzkoensis]MDE1668829.1 hypothetical protein [Nocardia gipuzkoensis]
MDSQLNAISELPQKMRVSRSTIFALIRSGQLGSILIAGRRFVSDAQIAEYLERQTQHPTAAA